jgi:hypothetical protein
MPPVDAVGFDDGLDVAGGGDPHATARHELSAVTTAIPSLARRRGLLNAASKLAMILPRMR